MNIEDKINNYIETNPRKSLQMVFFVLAFIWQSPAAIIGLLLYMVVSKIEDIKWWMMLTLGIIQTLIALWASGKNAIEFIRDGFIYNKIAWKCLANNDPIALLTLIFHHSLDYFLIASLLLSGILCTIDLIREDKHKATMKALREGKLPTQRKEISSKKLDSALKRIDETKFDCTVLGISKYTGYYAVVPDSFINQTVLVLGTTGAGKTVTLRRFYQRAAIKGYPLIVIDGKPSDSNVTWLKEIAEQHNRQFYGFNCANYYHYDCLASGGYTELKDKIISLKDEWESDYYRSIAEDYLQTTFQVLLKSGKAFDLRTIADCLDHDNLRKLADEIDDEALIKKVITLAHYDRKDILGLQAHINILINSELGEYFDHDISTFTLPAAIEENAIVYFALPALRFPSFSKVLGKLIINDLKAVIDRYCREENIIFMVFDEFSVFAGDQVLNVVNMGREKGVHAIFGTQGLGDL